MIDRIITLRKPLDGPDGPITTLSVRLPAAADRDRCITGYSVAQSNVAALTGIPIELVGEIGDADLFEITLEYMGAISAARQAQRWLDGSPFARKKLGRLVLLEAPIDHIRRVEVRLGEPSVEAATGLARPQAMRLSEDDADAVFRAMCVAPGEAW